MSNRMASDCKIIFVSRGGMRDILFDGMTIMSGGFELAGNPESLISEIRNPV